VSLVLKLRLVRDRSPDSGLFLGAEYGCVYVLLIYMNYEA
jgi:hypothetical protein